MNDSVSEDSLPNGRGSGEWARSRAMVFLLGLSLGLCLSPYCSRIPTEIQKAYFPLNGPKGYDTNDDENTDYWRIYSGNRWDEDRVDRNLDQKPDEWNYYEDEVRIRSEYDLNFDGAVDRWDYYQDSVLARSEYDLDFDGGVDEWEVFENGERRSYRADNDGDGRVDEWGTFENGSVRERNWSFRNDDVADKKALYHQGRKTTELYDRDRDGEFEEEVRLDEFERVLTTGKPRPR